MVTDQAAGTARMKLVERRAAGGDARGPLERATAMSPFASCVGIHLDKLARPSNWTDRLAVDHTKLGTRAQARMFDLENVDLLVTDLDPDDVRLKSYRPFVQVS